MRLRDIASIPGLIGLFLFAGISFASAQPAKPAAESSAADAQITADSPPYRIEWNGNSGVFIRKADAQQPEQRMSLAFVHTDAGPAGYAKHLAWFLARDTKGFSLLWCYLNDTGKDFTCWLYRYPANQLTSLHFIGAYHYTPLPEPPAPTPMNDFTVRNVPQYDGPNFAYRDWTGKGGALAQLALLQPKQPDTTSVPGNDVGTPIKTLTDLQVKPLHEVEVGAANGWRDGGWKELHALAFDAANDPYYLILYSNTSHGYVLDLKRAQVYTTDFFSRVRFGDDGPDFGPKDNPLNIEPDIKVHRFERDEILLTSKQTFTNPYVEAQVGIEFRSPNAKTITVPGFWDGGNTWRVRFAPTVAGIWTWHSLSKIPDLNGQIGEFECINEDVAEKGYINVQPAFQDSHHFSYANGDPFLPAYVREPAAVFTTPSAGASSAGANTTAQTRLAVDDVSQPTSTASLVQFQKLVNACAGHGFNRFVGGNLLGPAAAKTVRANEGGTLCFDGNLDRINPAFFQWMDRRIAYCNVRGIVPDIGIGELSDALFTTYKPEALFRLWGYVVARYAAYDVNWTLFSVNDSSLSPGVRKNVDEFEQLTRFYDPNLHPVTLIMPGPVAVKAAPPAAAASGGNSEFDSLLNQFLDGSGDAPPSRPAQPPVRNNSANNSQPPPVVAPKTAFQEFPWQDILTYRGGDVTALPDYWSATKPIVVVERTTPGGMTPEIARVRMWETRMRGDYWVAGTVPSDTDPNALDIPELKWAAACADFFRRTRFSRLSPHQEMLGGPEESPADRKRRKRAELAEALRKEKIAEAQDDSENPDDTGAPPEQNPPGSSSRNPVPPVGSELQKTNPTVPAAAPIFVLADPAREYIVYFEKGGSLMLDLLEATGRISVTWFNPRTGEFSPVKKILGGAYTTFAAPDNNDWVLYLSRR